MAQVRVRKNNRIILVDETQVNGYLVRGYDQVDATGNIVKHATGGKTISLAEHHAALDELKRELEEVKQKAEKFAEKGKKLQEENEKLKKQLNKK